MFFIFFFFNDTATTEIYTLSLHDALPISPARVRRQGAPRRRRGPAAGRHPGRDDAPLPPRRRLRPRLRHGPRAVPDTRRGRLAQQPAPPARGLRHLGHEGGPERRPQLLRARRLVARGLPPRRKRLGDRSEEHTSELQSPCNLVCRLLLEKKKKKLLFVCTIFTTLTPNEFLTL